MKLARRLADIALVLLLTMGLAWTAGHIAFTPAAADLLVGIADRFDFHGMEAVEEFYATVTLCLSLAVAIAVMTLRRHLSKRSARRRDGGATMSGGSSRTTPERANGRYAAASRSARGRLSATPPVS